MSENPATDVAKLLNEELDAGIFGEKFANALSKVALGTINHPRKKGSLVLEFKFEALDTVQVQCYHTLKFSIPTRNGKAGEENTTNTPLYVGRGGKLTLQQENQGQLFTIDGQPNQKRT